MNEELIEVKLFNFDGYKILASTYEEASLSYEKHKQKEQNTNMSEEKLENEFNYTKWLKEMYAMEKQYSKRMEESALLAYKHIGRLQAMLSYSSYHLSDVDKEEIKKDLEEMHKEREDFYEKYKSETNIK